jgi:hypothetical protein
MQRLRNREIIMTDAKPGSSRFLDKLLLSGEGHPKAVATSGP